MSGANLDKITTKSIQQQKLYRVRIYEKIVAMNVDVARCVTRIRMARSVYRIQRRGGPRPNFRRRGGAKTPKSQNFPKISPT